MKVLVLGSKGMVGSSVSRMLKNNNDIKVFESARSDTNLFSLTETKELFANIEPDIVVNAATMKKHYSYGISGFCCII